MGVGIVLTAMAGQFTYHQVEQRLAQDHLQAATERALKAAGFSNSAAQILASGGTPSTSDGHDWDRC